MFDAVLIIAAIAAAGWLALSMLLAWENRRFAFSRMKTKVPVRRREHRTQLTVPCKGDDMDLAENLRAFFLQTHPNFELVFVVESKEDGALPVIERIRSEFPKQDCRVVIAGIANKEFSDGQKVHNLRAATQSIPPEVRVMAFADADIRPDADWLQTLCYSVCKAKNAAANTGYRWMIPETNSLANLLAYSINTTIAGAMGSGGHQLIWGGAWAIRRNNFQRLSIHSDWQNTLSDDLVASRTIREKGERIIFDPRCLCATPFHMSAISAIEFLRRQYLIGRKYAPKLFWSSWLVCGVSVTTWFMLVAMTASNAGGYWPVWAALLVALYSASVTKGWMRQSVLKRRDNKRFAQQRTAATFDMLAAPLTQTINFLLMSSILFSSKIWWRGNHYEIKNGGSIRLLNASTDSIENNNCSPATPSKGYSRAA